MPGELGAFRAPDTRALRRPLGRLGMEFERRHRQLQGDDIDIDAAVEALIELKAGSVPRRSGLHRLRTRRRDLSVLVLLDISGSAGEPGADRRARARPPARRGRQPGRGPARARRPRGALRVPIARAIGRAGRAGQAVRRGLRCAGAAAAGRARSRRLHAVGCGDPPRHRRPRGGGGHGDDACSWCSPMGSPTTTATSGPTARRMPGGRWPRRAGGDRLRLPQRRRRHRRGALRRVFGTAAHARHPTGELLPTVVGTIVPVRPAVGRAAADAMFQRRARTRERLEIERGTA